MSHANIVSNIKQFVTDVGSANAIGKDYVLRASLINIKRTYFHHGTIGACQYCFWGRYTTGAPYYGAYTAVAAMAGGSYISALDPGTSSYGVYVIYNAAKTPIKVLLYNSDYYSGTGTRATGSFVLSGLGATAKSKRLTAPNSNSRVDQGQTPTFGGQNFANITCNVGGTETFEIASVVSGKATFVVGASEALLVYL